MLEALGVAPSGIPEGLVAHLLVLDLLGVAGARRLLMERIGADRSTAEPEAVRDITAAPASAGCSRLARPRGDRRTTGCRAWPGLPE